MKAMAGVVVVAGLVAFFGFPFLMMSWQDALILWGVATAIIAALWVFGWAVVELIDR